MSHEFTVQEVRDKLTSLETSELVTFLEVYIESEPLNKYEFVCRNLANQKGKRVSTFIKELKEQADYILFWKVYDMGLIDCEMNEEQFLDHLRKEWAIRKKYA